MYVGYTEGASHVTCNTNKSPDDHFCGWLLFVCLKAQVFYYATLTVDQNELKCIEMPPALASQVHGQPWVNSQKKQGMHTCLGVFLGCSVCIQNTCFCVNKDDSPEFN